MRLQGECMPDMWKSKLEINYSCTSDSWPEVYFEVSQAHQRVRVVGITRDYEYEGDILE